MYQGASVFNPPNNPTRWAIIMVLIFQRTKQTQRD